MKRILCLLILASSAMMNGQQPAPAAWFNTAPTGNFPIVLGHNSGLNVYGPSNLVDNGTNLLYKGSIVGAGSFAAGGDLSGNSTSQTVIGINNTVLSVLGNGRYKFTSGVPSLAMACTDYAGLPCANIFRADQTITGATADGLALTLTSANTFETYLGIANSTSGGTTWYWGSPGSANHEGYMDLLNASKAVQIAFSSGMLMGSGGAVGWSSGATPITADTVLRRAGVDSVACGNGGGTDSSCTFQEKLYQAGVGTQITAAATIAPTFAIHHITGATQVTTITPPANFASGWIGLIPDDASGQSTGMGGDIALGTTMVQNKLLILSWDGVKWNPSY